MFTFTLFALVAGPLLLLWGGYHAFIKKDFAAIKSDFTIGIAFLVFAGLIFYLLSLV